MKVTMLTAGSRGDVQPYLALAMGLQRAGHAVRLATHPGFEHFVRARGVEFAPVAQVTAALTATPLWQRWQQSGDNVFAYVYYFFRVARQARALIATMVADFWAATQGADMIVSSTSGFGGPLMAAERGVPHAWALFQPMSRTGAFPHFMTPGGRDLGRRGNRFTYWVAEHVYWLLFRPAVNSWLVGTAGRPPLRRPQPDSFLGRRPAALLYGFSRHVVPPPDDWGPATAVCGYWFLDPPDTWQPEERLRAFLAAGERPIFFYLSGINYRPWAALLRMVLRALEALGRRGIVYLGTGDDDGVAWPDSVLPVRSVPHAWLFPQVAAVVHHGGAGTTASALRAGVPAVIIPGYWDQPFWARRVQALDAAPPPIPVRQLSDERLGAALRALLERPLYHANAARLGRLIAAEDGVGRGTALLESLARGVSSRQEV